MSKFWYDNKIEEPIRDIIRNLRNEGINTFCSCGHGLWIQCETYDPTNDLDTIYNVLVSMGIKEYRVQLYVHYSQDYHHNRFLEITLPDKNGNYYNIQDDNNQFQQQKIKGES